MLVAQRWQTGDGDSRVHQTRCLRATVDAAKQVWFKRERFLQVRDRRCDMTVESAAAIAIEERSPSSPNDVGDGIEKLFGKHGIAPAQGAFPLGSMCVCLSGRGERCVLPLHRTSQKGSATAFGTQHH